MLRRCIRWPFPLRGGVCRGWRGHGGIRSDEKGTIGLLRIVVQRNGCLSIRSDPLLKRDVSGRVGGASESSKRNFCELLRSKTTRYRCPGRDHCLYAVIWTRSRPQSAKTWNFRKFGGQKSCSSQLLRLHVIPLGSMPISHILRPTVDRLFYRNCIVQ